MPEGLPIPYFARNEFPFLFNSAAAEIYGREADARANAEFARSLIPPQEDGAYDALDGWTIHTLEQVLTEADHRFGRNTGELGVLQRQLPDGIWGQYAMPTFYHNGDGTRLAMLGTANYMDFVNKIDPDSPYKDRKTYLAALLTAAYDDIVFGDYGRGEDEDQSKQVARQHMEHRGFPADMVDAVIVGIEASKFNEKTGKQNVDPTKGYLAVQEASVIGDLWALGTSIASTNAELLAVENLWKRDTTHRHNQILRNVALNEWLENQWSGRNVNDFLALAQAHPEARSHFGVFLRDNENFLMHLHRYPDERVDHLMHNGKRQNGILQGHIGRVILDGTMTTEEGLRCAVSYAIASDRRLKSGVPRIPTQKEAASLVQRKVTPKLISGLILKRRSLDVIQQPLDADAFFDRYQAAMRSR
jgi:hypothetical protein